MSALKGNLHAHTTFSDGRFSIDEVIARYRELGYDFLDITDHEDRIPNDYWFRIPGISRDGFPIQAVEITDTGIYQAEYDVDAIDLPKIATDDSHDDEHIGRAWIEVDASRAPDAILRAIKAGDFAVR